MRKTPAVSAKQFDRHFRSTHKSTTALLYNISTDQIIVYPRATAAAMED